MGKAYNLMNVPLCYIAICSNTKLSDCGYMKKMPILFPSLTCREERDDVLREVGMCVLRSTGGPVYIVV